MTKEAKVYYALLLILLAVALVGTCSCIIPEHQKKANEVNYVGWGKVEKDERLPPDTRSLAKAERKMNEALLEKHGESEDVITENNVEEKAGETTEETKQYQPWSLTGSSLFDIALMLLGGGGVFAGRKTLLKFGRMVGHLITHNGPQKKESI